jgi:hypothetical protein
MVEFPKELDATNLKVSFDGTGTATITADTISSHSVEVIKAQGVREAAHTNGIAEGVSEGLVKGAMKGIIP